MSRITGQSGESLLDDISYVLDCWHLAVAADGRLWVRPRRSMVTLRDLCILLKRIHRSFRGQGLASVDFCFEYASVSRSDWQVFVSVFTAFARTMESRCRLMLIFPRLPDGTNDFARDGDSRLDDHSPALFLDAVSYLYLNGDSGGTAEENSPS